MIKTTVVTLKLPFFILPTFCLLFLIISFIKLYKKGHLTFIPEHMLVAKFSSMCPCVCPSSLCCIYRIFLAIRRGFRPSKTTSNNLISPMKFCYNTNSTLPKQCQTSRSILQDGSRTFGLFWKEKTPSYNRRNTVYPSERISSWYQKHQY